MSFARAILLSGNGTLLINNTFVEWATMRLSYGRMRS